ncbi:hypothetical protein D3C85_768530 [compost metagenome]
MTVTTRGFLGKADIGDIAPRLHGQYRLVFLQRAELAEPTDLQRGEAGPRRREERVGQFDLAVTVEVLPGRTVTQNLRRGLINGIRGFAIDHKITATVILMAETIDLRPGSTGGGRRFNSFNFYFRHKHTSLFSNGTVFVR